MEELVIKTIEDSHRKYSKRDQIKADAVRRFQQIAGFPSDATIIHSVNTNSVKNSPFTQRDVEISKAMLGPSIYAAKGKTTRTQPDTVNVTL